MLREIGYVREMGEGMRRIFKLMSEADLIPPEIISNPGQFSIILHHKSVFSEADQKWLAGFAPLKLTRDEMLIALLGKNGNLISPQQIYDRLGLVDWDVYRTFFEQMHAKGILRNTMTEFEKGKASRRNGLSKREIPRLAIRQPDEIEKGLAELYIVLKQSSPVPYLNKQNVSTILSFLPTSNPFRTVSFRLTFLLEVLGLITSDGRPSIKLFSLWGKEPRSFTAPNSAKAVSSIKVDTMKKKVLEVDKCLETKIFVGNIDYSAKEDELIELFSKIGKVCYVTMPQDYVTQRNRGFCFVNMSTREEAEDAIEKLNGTIFKGRALRLSW